MEAELTRSRRIADPLARVLIHGSLAVMVVLLLFAAGRPIYTDDVWWHLELGEAIASAGPWLSADPMLFTATGPPAPAAWLFELGLFELLRAGGFAGLKIAHAVAIAGILALAWWLLRRASGSSAVASLATCAFAALAAYRLFQLRPHLFTMFAALLLYALVLEKEASPSNRRILAAALLCGLWANLHAGFLLGPILLGAGFAGAVVAAVLASAPRTAEMRARAKRLAIVSAAGLLASLVNPSGPAAHLAYLLGGSSTPDLTLVSDEWTAFDPFRLPSVGALPSPLAWALVWLLLLLVPLIVWRAARRRESGSPWPALDLVQLSISGASILAMLIAVRFLWLGIFPLLLIGSAWHGQRAGAAVSVRALAAAAAVLLIPAFVAAGDWTRISKGVPREWTRYAEPYPARKYFGHAVWFLRDTGVSGNVFNDYFMGGFLGFWLAPELRTFVNGSLNVPISTMDAYREIRARRGLEPDGDFLSLLDEQRIDFFLGLGLPSTQSIHQPRRYTTAHLERAPDAWLPVFRNLRSGIAMRNNARNRENLRRIADYYASEGVPFEPSRGFEVDLVIREAPEWAAQHGVIPPGFANIVAARFDAEPARSIRAANRLAGIYAALGLYEHAVRLDRRTLSLDAEQTAARRRLVWSLLRLDDAAAALEAAKALDAAPESDPLARRIANAAREYASLGDPRERDALVALLPAFTQREGGWVTRGFVNPEARPYPGPRTEAAGAPARDRSIPR